MFHKQTLRVVSLSPLALTCSCTHQNIPSASTYRQIQEHEASLARAQVRLESSAPCSEQRAREVGTLCESGDAICALGREIDEADALMRCQRARDMCAAARASEEPSCLHPPQP